MYTPVVGECTLDCQNGGTCVPSDDGQHYCRCPPQFQGELCEGNIITAGLVHILRCLCVRVHVGFEFSFILS